MAIPLILIQSQDPSSQIMSSPPPILPSAIYHYETEVNEEDITIIISFLDDSYLILIIDPLIESGSTMDCLINAYLINAYLALQISLA